MIIKLKASADERNTTELIDNIKGVGLRITDISNLKEKVYAVTGNTSIIDTEKLTSNQIVASITPINEPYKEANRKVHPEDTIVEVDGVEIGGEKVVIIAGPCSVESEEQVMTIAKEVKKSGASMIRGGAYKPRTSPYSFQGMGIDGLKLLKHAKAEYSMPIVSELMSTDKIDEFMEYVDVIQVGARNMQNFELLKLLGQIDKPILLKRGFSNTIEELLMAAEYVMAGGNRNIVLCERGIRTFEKYTRNTLDISAIPVIKNRTHLPVIVDPSHATGHWQYVESLALAAVVAGADGVMVEVHNLPSEAKCDGAQSLKPEKFHRLMQKMPAAAQIAGRK